MPLIPFFSSKSSSTQPDAETSQQSASVAPPWAAEMAEQLLKLSRAQARIGLRFDELQSQVDAGFASLRGPVAPADLAKSADLAPLLDAMDLLDDLASQHPGDLGEGLQMVVQRLNQLVVGHGLQRAALLGRMVDGRLAEVNATVAVTGVAAGVVVRVVRAPVLRGLSVFRQGAVVVSSGESA